MHSSEISDVENFWMRKASGIVTAVEGAQLRACAGAALVAEVEVFPPHRGPGSPGGGMGGVPEVEMADEWTVCRVAA